ncbi:hypothetical protein WISP_144155 [Willisornis vidua]|uniref:Uncharacterized protein n=1 Tax=Willisornis vidua TaxID=1566151 RepID=A0ABQ9CL92_9PASS|nr:hypothetical protein WISP_144155 [Willisornis vidua]
MGKDQELLEAARTGNVALVEKLLSGRKGGILGSGSGAIPLSSLLSITVIRSLKRRGSWDIENPEVAYASLEKENLAADTHSKARESSMKRKKK